MFWSALRRSGERALAEGILTVTDLRTGVPIACTLHQCTKLRSPLPADTTRGDRAFPEAPLKFSVEVEHSTIAWLVRLGLIPPNETRGLAAILVAMNRIGLTPSISCSA
jgi:hypothetical protein